MNENDTTTTAIRREDMERLRRIAERGMPDPATGVPIKLSYVEAIGMVIRQWAVGPGGYASLTELDQRTGATSNGQKTNDRTGDDQRE